MDSTTRLDYALFQLTPTRTRCDLLVYSGSKCEKLASGLLEPFLTQLRSAKEQISKGGYSITLRPGADADWFTKATLERFVRFVSTPEILERLVTIETEISQIQNSVHANDVLMMVPNPNKMRQTEEGNLIASDGNSKNIIVPSMLKAETNGDEAAQVENSKLRLHRILETRKAVLRKEQGMAYAKAFVAGFEVDHIGDLISFADAFGASRLREACVNFKELCTKKHEDGFWIDELAAIEACSQSELSFLGTSGIMLTSGPSISQCSMPNGKIEQSTDAAGTDSTINHPRSNTNADNGSQILGQMPSVAANDKTQVPTSWVNQQPQSMYKFQSPLVNQIPPYQGYPFHNMQVASPYYMGQSGKMCWPPYAEDPSHGISRDPDQQKNHNTPSTTKNKSINGKGPKNSENTFGDQNEYSDHSEYSSAEEVDAYLPHDMSSSDWKPSKKKPRKKSSRTVVIRNINYIASKRRDGEYDDSSTEDDFIGGNLLKQKVEEAVGSLEKNHKSTRNHHKKRGDSKHLSHTNGSNDTGNEHVENETDAKPCEEGKGDRAWGAFQNLLMRDDDPVSTIEQDNDRGASYGNLQHLVDVKDEYRMIKVPDLEQPSVNCSDFDTESKEGTKLRLVATDSVVITERGAYSEDNGHLKNFECNENYYKSTKRSSCNDGELLFPNRMESESKTRDPLSDYTHESLVTKSQREREWFIIGQPENLRNQEATAECSLFNEDRALALVRDAENHKKNFVVDDSFVVPTRATVDDQPISQWGSDISFVSGLTNSVQNEKESLDHSKDKLVMSGTYEPDDLYMVLERDSGVESIGASWTPEIDYTTDLSVKRADKKESGDEENGHVDDNVLPDCKGVKIKKEGDPEMKNPSKHVRSKTLRGSHGRSKTEIIPRNKKPSTVSRDKVQKSKLEQEEENRKKMEELRIERQKRIAQRSAGSGVTPATSKQGGAEIKTATKTSRPTIPDAKRASLYKAETIGPTKDHLTSGQSKHKVLATASKSTPPNKNGRKVDVLETRISSSKIAGDDIKKPGSIPVEISNCKSDLISSKPMTLDEVTNGSTEKTTLQIELINPQRNQSSDANQISHLDNSDNTKETFLREQKNLAGYNDDGSQNGQLDSLQLEGDFPGRSNIREEKPINDVPQNHEIFISSETMVDRVSSTTENGFNSNDFDVEHENGEMDENFGVSSEITSESVESTPYLINGMNTELTYSRKKWTSNGSPPAAKGIKKLLMFGRKSNNSPHEKP